MEEILKLNEGTRLSGETSVLFPEYEYCLDKAKELSDWILSESVTEENIKEKKETLAKARKVVTRFEEERKKVKNEILAPYKDFEERIKTITEIVDFADSTLRTQIRELEESERQEKLERIKEIWNLRIRSYKASKLIPEAFDLWFDQRFLNKTATVDSIETKMVEWLEMTEKDISVIEKMEYAADILAEYSACCDLAGSIDKVETHNEAKEACQVCGGKEEIVKLTIKGETQIKLAKLILTTNDIKFTEEKL